MYVTHFEDWLFWWWHHGQVDQPLVEQLQRQLSPGVKGRATTVQKPPVSKTLHSADCLWFIIWFASSTCLQSLHTPGSLPLPKGFSGFFRCFSVRPGGFISKYQPAGLLKLPGTSPDGIRKKRKSLCRLRLWIWQCLQRAALDSGLAATCFLFHCSVGWILGFQ